MKTLKIICLNIASNAFRVGDLVECMDDSGLESFIKKGYLYEVKEKVSSIVNGTHIKELSLTDGGRSFFPTRFRKAL